MSEEPPSILAPSGAHDPARQVRHIVIDIGIREGRWLEHLPWLETLAREAARDAFWAAGGDHCGATSLEIAVTFADDEFVRQLNTAHRAIDKPSNVLSFPAATEEDLAALRGGERTAGGTGGGDDASAPRDLLLGDVVLGLETIVKESADQGKPLADHVAHLVAHGVLHLLGFDHQEEEEAQRMEALETVVMEGLGIGDPYSVLAVNRGRP